MKFNLLGPFEITTDGDRSYTPSTPKVCQVLALLLTRPNEVVPVDSFIQELWCDNPPRSALTTLQTYVYHARKMFVNEGLVGPEDALLITRAPGYLIDMGTNELDTKKFEYLVEQGRKEVDQGLSETAARHLREAMELWHGPALANITTGIVLTGHIAYLEELRIRAAELRIEAITRLGQHRNLIPELRALVQEYPLNEWFHAQLIESLNLSGRRAEALQAYHNLRTTLSDELGLEPSPDLQQLQHQVLSPQHTNNQCRLVATHAAGRPMVFRH